MFKIYIENKGVIYEPIVLDSVNLSSEIQGMPAVLTFSVYKDEVINFTEGNSVRLVKFGVNMFSGFIFKKSRNKDNTILITAYDQLRYLKNKDTYNFTFMTASDIINRIAIDFNLKIGEIEDTSYIIRSQPESNVCLIDMIQNALDDTKKHKNEQYVFYDDFGKLTLKSTKNMIRDILITNEQAENFSYESSIDDNTYNRIKLVYEDGRVGIREVYEKFNQESAKNWGVLQYFDNIKEEDDGTYIANNLLKMLDKKTRGLSLTNVIGDTSLRAGCSIFINLDLGDILINNLMLVTKCTHIFTKDEHLMDIAVT